MLTVILRFSPIAYSRHCAPNPYRYAKSIAYSIQTTTLKPMLSAIQANTRIVLTTMAGCGSSRCCSSSPAASSAAYSRGLSRFNSAKGMWPVKIVVSMGNFSGRRWVLKKMHGKDETGGQQGLVTVDDGGHVDERSR